MSKWRKNVDRKLRILDSLVCRLQAEQKTVVKCDVCGLLDFNAEMVRLPGKVGCDYRYPDTYVHTKCIPESDYDRRATERAETKEEE